MFKVHDSVIDTNEIDGETWYLYRITYHGEWNQIWARSKTDAEVQLKEIEEIEARQQR